MDFTSFTSKRDFIVDPNQPKENFQPENMANLVYSSLTPLKVKGKVCFRDERS